MANEQTKSSRYPLIDVFRGIAIAMMIVFHFCYDLTEFKHADFDFYHSPFWLNFRTVIVSLFTFIVGIGLHLAHRNGLKWHKFIRRSGIILGCALLISITTRFTNDERFIAFGILHFIFVASMLGAAFIRLYWANLFIGLILLLVANLYQNPLFHQVHLQWIGFMEYKPATDDYAPLLPWFGVVLLGMFFARWAITEKHFSLIQRWQPGSVLTRTLAIAGVYSLPIYMLHQPLFLGLLKLHKILAG